MIQESLNLLKRSDLSPESKREVNAALAKNTQQLQQALRSADAAIAYELRQNLVTTTAERNTIGDLTERSARALFELAIIAPGELSTMDIANDVWENCLKWSIL